MAKKINVKLVLELRGAGMSRNGIASTRQMSMHSVSYFFNLADEKGIAWETLVDDLFSHVNLKRLGNNPVEVKRESFV